MAEKMIELVCSRCNKRFVRKQSIVKYKKKNGVEKFFCSIDCKMFANKIILKCAQCGKEIKRTEYEYNKNRDKNFFCSSSCSAKFNNIGKVRNKQKKRICKKCGINFYRKGTKSSILCQKCIDGLNRRMDEIKEMSIKFYHNLKSVRKKHPSWKNSHIRYFNRKWNENLLKYPCQVCGYRIHVELCHIKSISSFDEDEKLGVVNSQENNLVLCCNHHWEFDNGVIKLEDIPKRARNSIE